jgi:hypothetical protein
MRKTYFVFALVSYASLCAIGARADNFSFTGSIQTFTVPTTGTYNITAYGAQGGLVTSGYAGGLGAEIGGFVNLTAGQTLSILVGGVVYQP